MGSGSCEGQGNAVRHRKKLSFEGKVHDSHKYQAWEQNPFLARFVGDWATKEIVKQFMKNKWRNHYRNGWLDVPVKYAYLKNNASMRDPTASRKKTALSVGGAVKKTATREDVQDGAPGKGKGKAVSEEGEDEDDEEEDHESSEQDNGEDRGA
jgi:hypothetical protein